MKKAFLKSTALAVLLCLLFSMTAFAETAPVKGIDDFGPMWGGWKYDSSSYTFSLDGYDSAYLTWNCAAIFKQKTDISDIKLSCWVYVPTKAEFEAIPSKYANANYQDAFGHIELLSSGTQYESTRLQISWGYPGVRIQSGTNIRWVAVPQTENWALDGKWHYLTIKLTDGKLTVKYNKKAAETVTLSTFDAVNFSEVNGGALRLAGSNGFDTKIKNLVFTVGDTTYDYSDGTDSESSSSSSSSAASASSSKAASSSSSSSTSASSSSSSAVTGSYETSISSETGKAASSSNTGGFWLILTILIVAILLLITNGVLLFLFIRKTMDHKKQANQE